MEIQPNEKEIVFRDKTPKKGGVTKKQLHDILSKASQPIKKSEKEKS